jgi:hypothetical protein
MAAAQRPLAAARAEPTQAAAWRTIPSWALVGTEHRTIPPDSLRFMAKRAGSTIEEVKVSHVSMISRPDAGDAVANGHVWPAGEREAGSRHPTPWARRCS